jgi:hypothetical protein
MHALGDVTSQGVAQLDDDAALNPVQEKAPLFPTCILVAKCETVQE